MSVTEHRASDADVNLVVSMVRALLTAAYDHGADSVEYLALLAQCANEFDPVHVLDGLIVVLAMQHAEGTFIGEPPTLTMLRAITCYLETHPLTTPEDL